MHSPDVIQFFTEECLAVHLMLDGLQVPRYTYGERLSMSQRVFLLSKAHQDLVKHLGKTSPAA